MKQLPGMDQTAVTSLGLIVYRKSFDNCFRWQYKMYVRRYFPSGGRYWQVQYLPPSVARPVGFKGSLGSCYAFHCSGRLCRWHHGFTFAIHEIDTNVKRWFTATRNFGRAFAADPLLPLPRLSNNVPPFPCLASC